MNPVTPNTFIVSAIAWVAGLLMKKIKGIPNDTIPQLTYYVSLVSTYLLAVLAAVPTASAAAGPVEMPAPVDPMIGGSVSWILTTAWDWLGRKIVWGKLLKKVLK